MIKAIIWDLEGVILRTKDLDVPTTIARRLGASPEKIGQAFYSDFNDQVDSGEFTQDDFWNHILEEIGLPLDQKKHLVEFFHEDFFIDQQVLGDIQEYHNYYKTGLLSNFSEALRPMLANHWHVDGAFDEIVISCELGIIKPQAEIYLHMLKLIGCKAQEAIFIDDKLINVEGAKAVGLHAFQYKDRLNMKEQIQQTIDCSL